MVSSSHPGPTAETGAGVVRGATLTPAGGSGRGVTAFLGIPYAAPPVGRLRFRHPEPAAPWDGVRDATRPGPAAPQPGIDPLGSFVPGMVATRTDEDCLNLSVWAPASAGSGARLPVMVWIHGGGFTIGTSTLPTYDPVRLVQENDVVVVAPNYRLGALGFLAPSSGPARGGTDGIVPNCGLADLVLGLAWVRDNAASFGGDPDRVTVFGESAGAGAILHLLGSPAAAGLFRRAILQSPGVSQSLDPAQAAAVAADLMTRLGIDPSVPDAADRLRGVGAGALVEAQSATAAGLAASAGAMPFHPVVDGFLVPGSPVAALAAGRAADVEVVVGTTEDEMLLFVSPALRGLSHEHLVAVLRPIVSNALGADPGSDAVDDLVTRYEDWVAPTGGGAAEVWGAVMTDGLMRLPAETALEAQAAHQPNVYSYSFAWKPGGRAAERRSFHAIDLPFTFGTFDREGWGDLLGADAGAQEVSRSMRTAWAAFARDGCPVDAVGTAWPRWDPSRRATFVLADPVGVVDDPLAERRKAWEALRHV